MIHYLAHLFGFARGRLVIGTYPGDRRRALAQRCDCGRLIRPQWVGGDAVDEPETLEWRMGWGNEIVGVRRG